MPAWFAAAAPILGAVAQQAAQSGAGLIGQKKQYKFNKRLAQFQHTKNMELLKYQLDYNSPEAQMARFKEAGLNPNLVYDKGDAGNMSQAPKYPEIAPVDVQSAYKIEDLILKVNQAKLMQSQRDLTNTKVDESTVKQDLMKAQTALTAANPYMKKEYVNAMVLNLTSIARLKENEAGFMTDQQWRNENGEITRASNGYFKMQKELDLLYQKFNLGQADQQIKAQILQGKEFENALKEIQTKWMQDGEITSQHIYTGVMLLLQKLMR